MVSRENTVTGICIVAALVVGAAVAQFTDLPSWAAFAVFLFVGVILPMAINERADHDGSAP